LNCNRKSLIRWCSRRVLACLYLFSHPPRPREALRHQSLLHAKPVTARHLAQLSPTSHSYIYTHTQPCFTFLLSLKHFTPHSLFRPKHFQARLTLSHRRSLLRLRFQLPTKGMLSSSLRFYFSFTFAPCLHLNIYMIHACLSLFLLTVHLGMRAHTHTRLA